MPVRELAPEEEVLPLERTVRELRPDEEVIPPSEDVGDVRFEGLQPGKEFGGVESFGRGANVGIAKGFGAISDFSNFLSSFIGLDVEEPPGGSRQIQRGFAALGIAPEPGQPDPDTLLGSVGRVTGEATPFLFGVGPAASAARSVSAGTRAAPVTARGSIVQDIGRSAIEAPGRFITAEVAAAAGAGVGGFVAREKFPDSQAAETIGMILGGFTPAGIVGTAKVLPTVVGIRLARNIAQKFTKTGGQIRAERRVEEVTRDFERVQKELGAPEAIPEAGLTPAQRTGDEGLLALERAVIESSEQLKGEADEQIAQATRAIRENLTEIGEGVPPEKTAAALEEARSYLQSLVDTRMRIAARQADERIAALEPGSTRREANVVAREELEKALSDIRGQERQIWGAVPEEVILKTKNSMEAYAEILKKTPAAQREDIPTIAGKLLGRNEDIPEGFEEAFEAFGLAQKSARFGEKTTVAELQGLRSKLLEESRKARAAGEFNKARIADDLADAVLTDLGAQRDEVAGEAGEALRAALDFSADLNERFTRGPVGKLLGSEKRGGPRIAEELTLETTVGKGGPRARVEAQAIFEAADTPALRGAVEDFLLDDFQRRVVREGRIGPDKAEAFLRRHTDILDDFPELRAQIEGAIQLDDIARLRTQQAVGLAKRLADPKISRAAVFLKEPAEDAMKRIAKSPKPERTMREIVKQASRDPTGDAVKGVKTAFGDFLLQQSSTRTATVKGDFGVSGRAMKRLLEEGPTSRMAKALLTPDEQRRLKEIADVAERVEKALAARPEKGGIVTDVPSLLFATVARITGARVGRALNTGTIQAPGFVANLFNRAITARVQDPARRLLIDAMKDEQLFEALVRKGTADQKFVRRQLNAWLLSVGAEQISDGE